MTCNCIKLLDTYTIMEKNLLNVIDLLQFEKNNLLKDYQSKISNLEKKILEMESSENKKTLQLGNELLQQKIACHEMENRLKLAEENLKLATTKKNLNLKIESSKEIHQFSKSANASNMINLLNNLYCKVSSNFLQMKDGTRNCSDAENEIHTLFHLIFSEIK